MDSPNLNFLLFRVQGLLGQHHGLHRRLNLRLGLNHPDFGAADILLNLVLLLQDLFPQLPLLQQGARNVRLRGAIANGKLQSEAERIVRIIAVKQLRQRLRDPLVRSDQWPRDSSPAAGQALAPTFRVPQTGIHS